VARDCSRRNRSRQRKTSIAR